MYNEMPINQSYFYLTSLPIHHTFTYTLTPAPSLLSSPNPFFFIGIVVGVVLGVLLLIALSIFAVYHVFHYREPDSGTRKQSQFR